MSRNVKDEEFSTNETDTMTFVKIVTMSLFQLVDGVCKATSPKSQAGSIHVVTTFK